MRRIALLFSFSFCLVCQSQTIDSLSMLIKDIQKGSTDSIRIASNAKFLSGFGKLLERRDSLTEKLDSLTNISIKSSDDGKLKIYSWVLPHYDGNQYDYFGYIRIHDENTDTILQLHDSTGVILKPESEKLSPDRWFGMIYYDVITTKKSKNTFYTLLGWKGINENITKKVIDVLVINKGKLQFGYPLFKTGSVYKNRMIFTYNAHSVMTLRNDRKYGGIVFDNISTSKSNPLPFGGPDGTYNIFKWKKGKWILEKDTNVGTRWEPTETLPVPPENEKEN